MHLTASSVSIRKIDWLVIEIKSKQLNCLIQLYELARWCPGYVSLRYNIDKLQEKNLHFYNIRDFFSLETRRILKLNEHDKVQVISLFFHTEVLIITWKNINNVHFVDKWKYFQLNVSYNVGSLLLWYGESIYQVPCDVFIIFLDWLI